MNRTCVCIFVVTYAYCLRLLYGHRTVHPYRVVVYCNEKIKRKRRTKFASLSLTRFAELRNLNAKKKQLMDTFPFQRALRIVKTKKDANRNRKCNVNSQEWQTVGCKFIFRLAWNCNRLRIDVVSSCSLTQLFQFYQNKGDPNKTNLQSNK